MACPPSSRFTTNICLANPAAVLRVHACVRELSMCDTRLLLECSNRLRPR